MANMANRKPTEAVRQAWLEQLIREFKGISWNYQVQLRTPIFELSAGQKQLGCWLPEQRILRISEHLIVSSSWDVVLMVLKHEMAHQVCSEYFGLPHEGHGKAFQKACQMLGVPAPYNRATGDLPEILAEPSGCEQTEEGRKIIQRVNKLLRLASSDNEHEAALAMERATELLYRHNLAMANLDERSDCVRLLIQTGKKQIPTWRKNICCILMDYFFVEVVFSSFYDAQRQDSYKALVLLGRAENVPVAEHCYHFLEQQLAVLWEKNRHRFQGNTRTAKNSYYLGLLDGFTQKLTEQAEKVFRKHQDGKREVATGELMISKDNQLQDFVSFHFPRLRTTKNNAVKLNKDSYEDAIVAGKKIVLHQSLAEKKQGRQRLLCRKL